MAVYHQNHQAAAGGRFDSMNILQPSAETQNTRRRQRYCLRRPDGTFVPLISVDQTPQQLIGVPEMLTAEQVKSRGYAVVGDADATASRYIAEPGLQTAAPSSDASLLSSAYAQQPFRQTDARPRDLGYNDRLMPAYQPRPVQNTSSHSSSSLTNEDDQPYRSMQTTPETLNSHLYNRNAAFSGNQAMSKPNNMAIRGIDEQMSTRTYAARNGLRNHMQPISPMAMATLSDDMRLKTHCWHYFHKDGECGFAQVGCRFSHEFPHNWEDISLRTGLNSIPDWFKRRYPDKYTILLATLGGKDRAPWSGKSGTDVVMLAPQQMRVFKTPQVSGRGHAIGNPFERRFLNARDPRNSPERGMSRGKSFGSGQRGPPLRREILETGSLRRTSGNLSSVFSDDLIDLHSPNSTRSTARQHRPSIGSLVSDNMLPRGANGGLEGSHWVDSDRLNHVNAYVASQSAIARNNSARPISLSSSSPLDGVEIKDAGVATAPAGVADAAAKPKSQPKKKKDKVLPAAERLAREVSQNEAANKAMAKFQQQRKAAATAATAPVPASNATSPEPATKARRAARKDKEKAAKGADKADKADQKAHIGFGVATATASKAVPAKTSKKHDKIAIVTDTDNKASGSKRSGLDADADIAVLSDSSAASAVVSESDDERAVP